MWTEKGPWADWHLGEVRITGKPRVGWRECACFVRGQHGALSELGEGLHPLSMGWQG